MSILERQQIRLSADVGGTFTDVAAFDETTGELRLGKTLTTPAKLVDGIENGVGKAGAQFRAARLFLHGTTVAINTILERSGAHMRAAHHAGLPRHLRDRPRQPAGVLQPVLPEARAADRARAALRDHGADGRAGQGADPARRGGGARPWSRQAVAQGVAGDRHPVPALLPQSGARAAREGDHRARCTRSCSSRRRTSCRRSIASSSAPRPSPPTPISARACGAISPRWTSISTTPASAAIS